MRKETKRGSAETDALEVVDLDLSALHDYRRAALLAFSNATALVSIASLNSSCLDRSPSVDRADESAGLSVSS